MSRIGFFSQVNGYWETLEEPPGHIVEKYPADTVRIHIKPGDGYEWDGAQWVESAPVVVIPPVTPPTPEQTETMRKAAYQAEADPLFFKYQRGEIEKQVWLDKVQEIKERYPY